MEMPVIYSGHVTDIRILFQKGYHVLPSKTILQTYQSKRRKLNRADLKNYLQGTAWEKHQNELHLADGQSAVTG